MGQFFVGSVAPMVLVALSKKTDRNSTPVQNPTMLLSGQRSRGRPYTIGYCCGNRVYRSVQPRAHAGPARQAAVHFLSMMVHARVRPICRRYRRAAPEGVAVEARSGTILLLAALIPLCHPASVRGPKLTQPGPANSPTDGPRAGAHHHGEEMGASCRAGPA